MNMAEGTVYNCILLSCPNRPERTETACGSKAVPSGRWQTPTYNHLKSEIMAIKFFKCMICGNVIVKFVDSGVVPVCCGEEMEELYPASTDGKTEYHVPVIERKDECTILVRVGEKPHPMTPEHYIAFICLETEQGCQVRSLAPGEPAEATFCVCKDKAVAAYCLCNLHGLWKTFVKSCLSCG